MKSLKAQLHNFSDSQHQLTILRDNENALFEDKLNDLGLFPLRATGVEILQLNIGKMCNQVCKHCHVDAGPDRKEIMTKETMMQCLEVIRNSSVTTVDLTGGAPEMNPHFRWLVEEIWKTGKKIMVRCNLTIILANPKYHDLPEFYRQHQVEVVSSLPYYTALRTDNQRGDGVFERSIKALQMLNDSGYGKEGTNLILNLVYNPSG
ncbi:MAG: radical SAM protein, partial [Bacteroidota bacterium]|nr:radical SAM protein [Bacteroidota bacterium]